MELMYQGVVLSFLRLEHLTVWNVPSLFTCLALGIFRVYGRTLDSSFILLEDHWALRFCGTKQNRSMWKTDVILDWKFTKLLVSTILLQKQIVHEQSTWFSLCACRSASEVVVAGYKDSFRHTQNQICLCGPSGGISHEVVLQMWCAFSFAFTVTHFER